ncbi:hypothetical protein B5G43_09775 [Flavonifractor sp. An92]|nr:hypothetical protein B5G43_09775 [Flavonifractor sp. An92]OUQ22820.1 hypothetical protein B5E80_12020 [Flavonifractor sp. An135]
MGPRWAGCQPGSGRLLGGSTAFFAKKAVGKKAQRGDTPLWTPPRRIPAFILLRRYFLSLAWPILGFPPIRKALYPGNMGRPHKRPPFWRGVERGTRSSPLLLFFPRFLFEKRNRALSAQDTRVASTNMAYSQKICYTFPEATPY